MALGIIVSINTIIVILSTLFITKQQSRIMATIKDLTDKVNQLQADLDAEQEQIKAAIGALTTEVEKLRADVVDGGTAEERQALADKLDGVISDLKGTIPDAPETPETPEGGGEETPPAE